MNRQLILEDGTILEGEAFGSLKEQIGEIVFNTSMTGYQEALSDPSYYGQIVAMTYPVIGNYGINRDDFETITPATFGLIVKEYSKNPSNFRSEEELDGYLKANDIPGISGIDTRKLTKILRKNGTMRGILTQAGDNINKDSAMEKINHTKPLTNQVELVSTIRPYVAPGRGYRIVVVDFGLKHGILRELTKRDCHVTVVPYNYSAENILRLKPDGIMLTNGPGNPENVPEAIHMLKDVIRSIPTFGICLGHQLLALACEADTSKLKFGHRGANHPVYDYETERTYITSQNHSYVVTEESIENTDLEITQRALNDRTIEGIKHKKYPAFAVQYNPEGSPGPDDTNYLFDRFIETISEHQATQKEEA